MRDIVCIILSAVLWYGCKSTGAIEGTYTTTLTVDFVGTNYWLHADSTFTTNGWTCFGRDTGAGHYVLTKDSIIFYYDTLEMEKFGRIVIDTLPLEGDSCTLRVHVHDESAPVFFAIVSARTESGTSFIAVADTAGEAILTVPRNSFPLTVESRMTGYTAVRIVIPEPLSATVNIRMRQRMFLTPGGTIMAFGVKKINRRKIVLTSGYIDEAGKKRTIESILYRRALSN